MASERTDDPAETRTAPATWPEYYAEASRRRRQRGWHRRRDFSEQRKRGPKWSVIFAGATLGLAALATVIALLMPR